MTGKVLLLLFLITALPVCIKLSAASKTRERKPGYRGIQLWTTSFICLMTALIGHARKGSLIERGLDKMDSDGLPLVMSYELELKGLGRLDLTLLRDRTVPVPTQSMRNKQGRFETHQELKNNFMVIYQDVNGHGSFACKPKSNGRKRIKCEMTGIARFVGEDCVVRSSEQEADCMPRPDGQDGGWRHYQAPDLTYSSRSQGQGSRKKRLDLPTAGYKVVEIAFILDKAFMQPFYERHPDSPEAAQSDAREFITLLAAEMNIYYSSLKEVTDGSLDLYVYPAVVVMPEAGQDWDYITPYIRNGQYLDSTGSFDSAMGRFVNSGFTTVQWDHAMTLTGLDLLNQDSTGQYSTGLLGYAYLSTVCTQSNYKYSINEFTTFNVVETAVHELGHALGASHDDGINCPNNTYIMSPNAFEVTTSTLNTYNKFSTCSAENIQDHLAGFPDCLVNNGFTDRQFEEALCTGTLGSQDSSLDRQCQRLIGLANSTACDEIAGDAGCYTAYSVRCITASGSCSRYLRFVWNGTPCGNGPAQICYKGRCVDGNQICTDVASTSTPASSTTSLTTSSTTSTLTSISQTSSTPTSTELTPSSTGVQTAAGSTTTSQTYTCTCCIHYGDYWNFMYCCYYYYWCDCNCQ